MKLISKYKGLQGAVILCGMLLLVSALPSRQLYRQTCGFYGARKGTVLVKGTGKALTEILVERLTSYSGAAKEEMRTEIGNWGP